MSPWPLRVSDRHRLLLLLVLVLGLVLLLTGDLGGLISLRLRPTAIDNMTYVQEIHGIDLSELENDFSEIFFRQTTCSENAFKLGRGQKVVAFTYFEDATYDDLDRDYFSGIRVNANLTKHFYPGHRMRLYFQIPRASPSRKRLRDIAKEFGNLDLCDVEKNPKFGNISHMYPLVWRFLPALDPQVALTYSRDLDSVITPRELAAVDEFLSKPRAHVHVMRDNLGHGIEMLGGTWGAKLWNGGVRRMWRNSFRVALANPLSYRPRTERGHDQTLLVRYVYPWAKHTLLAHDSFYCERYKDSIGFPTQRVEGHANFVGAVLSVNGRIDMTKKEAACPLACRRKKEWQFC